MAAAVALLLVGFMPQGALGQFGVSLPQTIEVLKGSCVTIPCSFDVPDSYESSLDKTCRAMWIKKYVTRPPVFDSSATQGTIQGQLNGDLVSKDCTTTLNDMTTGHSDDYFFRVHCDNGLKYSFSQRVNISVKADPHRPTLTPSTLRVREGASVSLTCSAPAPCLSLPPALTWTPGLGESQETLKENQDKTNVKTSVVNFTASHLHDGQEISCTAVYRKQDGSTESSVQSSLTANITYSPKDTSVSVSPSGPVKEDTNVTLTCSSNANPAVRKYTWYRADGGLEVFIGTGRVFNTRASKGSDPVFCKAENELGSGRSNNTQIDVQWALGQFGVSLPQTIEVLKGSCVTIPCSFDVSDSYESSLDKTCRALWIKGSVTRPPVFDSSGTQGTIQGQLNGDLVSKDCTTTLNDMTTGHSDVYFFRVDCDNGLKYSFSQRVNISVKADPHRPTLTPSTLRVREGASVSLTCSAPAPCLSLPPALTWTPGLGESQETLKENKDKTNVKTSVVNFTASHLHDGQEISCTAVYRKQDGSTESSVQSSLTAHITYSPKDTSVSVSPSGPAKEDTNVILTCSSNANPAVRKYTWYRADGGLEVFIGTGRVFSTRASKVSDPVFCKVENELGSGKSDTVHLDVQPHERSCSPFSGAAVLAVAGVSLALSIINTICMMLLWKQRKNVKPKEEDKTYATLESSNRSPDYDVIAQRHK